MCDSRDVTILLQSLTVSQVPRNNLLTQGWKFGMSRLLAKPYLHWIRASLSVGTLRLVECHTTSLVLIGTNTLMKPAVIALAASTAYTRLFPFSYPFLPFSYPFLPSSYPFRCFSHPFQSFSDQSPNVLCNSETSGDLQFDRTNYKRP